MSSDLQSFLAFLEAQKAKQAPRFPSVKFDKVLSFMGTTSLGGTYNAVSVNRVLGIEPGPTGRELRLRLAGPLARTPARGECITVHLTRVEQYQGFQVKTRALSVNSVAADLLEEDRDGLVVKGASIFTVHHSPYTLKFFENVPFEELVQIVGSVRYALVGVGETANISPRFIFHHEVRDGRLTLFHGDGLALKTYMNLKSNRLETRAVIDLDTYRGYALRGTVEEFAPHQHPEAYDKICRGYTAGGWGKPSRVFRSVIDDVAPLEPAG
ncbi:hypothetical protein [Anaeromyxobacter sp. PSR-1]|uniref:hypothetical protein n=1 Tax=Anaeromyxobacter sp. PSR-1 TaxID=1300915 RepID=UPI0005E056E6|nr:hypothetical protein [Anaeromyxobacter sp. PSR-1]GAO05309.1 hypothetical protein PSR1_04218 [Anaeromyxobacter sp. PSR-1]